MIDTAKYAQRNADGDEKDEDADDPEAGLAARRPGTGDLHGDDAATGRSKARDEPARLGAGELDVLEVREGLQVAAVRRRRLVVPGLLLVEVGAEVFRLLGV